METEKLWWIVLRHGPEPKVVFRSEDVEEARAVAHELNIHINLEFPGVYYTVTTQGDA